MARDIVNTSFSTEKVRAYEDYFLREESIAAATLPAVAVNGSRLGNIQSSLEIVVEAGINGVSVAATKSLVVKLQKCATVDGTYADVANGTIYTLVGAATKAAKEELARYTFPITDDFFYKAVAISDATNSGTINVYPHVIAR